MRHALLLPARRHAYGDQYRATDLRIPGAGKLELRFTPEGASEAQVRDGARGAARCSCQCPLARAAATLGVSRCPSITLCRFLLPC